MAKNRNPETIRNQFVSRWGIRINPELLKKMENRLSEKRAELRGFINDANDAIARFNNEVDVWADKHDPLAPLYVDPLTLMIMESGNVSGLVRVEHYRALLRKADAFVSEYTERVQGLHKQIQRAIDHAQLLLDFGKSDEVIKDVNAPLPKSGRSENPNKVKVVTFKPEAPIPANVTEFKVTIEGKEYTFKRVTRNKSN